MSQLSDNDEVLFRQIHPNFFEEGVLSSGAFKPSSNHNGRLSVDRSALTSPGDSFDLYRRRSLKSVAVYGLSVGDFQAEDVSCFSDPLLETASVPANPAHAVADFSKKKLKQIQNTAKRLKHVALKRGKLHP